MKKSKNETLNLTRKALVQVLNELVVAAERYKRLRPLATEVRLLTGLIQQLKEAK